MLFRSPFYAHSHQQGHLAAAAWSAGRAELLDAPFLAWHLSGGTTELLLVKPKDYAVEAEIIGGTSDLSAGQLIDRTGLLLGLQFLSGQLVQGLTRRELPWTSCPDRTGPLLLFRSGWTG